MSWSAKQYVAFEDERTRPVRDLLGALPDIQARSVLDIGCGPGNSTEVLAARFPDARIFGIDSSSDMIEAAQRRLSQAHLAVEDIDTWLGRSRLGAMPDAGPFEVILANAVLQWVPEHAKLLPALIERLSPGGALAVQMPDNLDEPAHRLMRELAANGPWAAKLAAAADARDPLADPRWYFKLLRPLCAKIDYWRTTYYHQLSGGAAAVVEWFKGSGLRPFLEPLDEGERTRFLNEYTAAIALAYPATPDHSVLLPFPRVFFVAVR